LIHKGTPAVVPLPFVIFLANFHYSGRLLFFCIFQEHYHFGIGSMHLSQSDDFGSLEDVTMEVASYRGNKLCTAFLILHAKKHEVLPWQLIEFTFENKTIWLKFFFDL
jgi:hypothetical protein